MQFTVRAVHPALKGGIDGPLLLDPVHATEAFVDDLGGVVVAVSGKIGDGDPGIGERLADQFLDFTKNRAHTFSDGGDTKVVHLDVTNPYAPEIRDVIEKAGKELGFPIHNGGTYVCTEGPRFETPAEIKMYALLGGDTVGMTNVPEVTLAGEAEIAYATISMVTNFAAGISKTELTHKEVTEIMAQLSESFRALILKTIDALDPDMDCAAHHRLAEYGGFKVALGSDGADL